MLPMPGNDLKRAPTTARIWGTTEISRRTRMMRKARNTASGPAAGSQAMATMAKSNRFQPLRKKRPRHAASFNPSSSVNTHRATVSMARNHGPIAAIAVFDVSRPSEMALITMTTVIVMEKTRDSTRVARLPRSIGGIRDAISFKDRGPKRVRERPGASLR